MTLEQKVKRLRDLDAIARLFNYWPDVSFPFRLTKECPYITFGYTNGKQTINGFTRDQWQARRTVMLRNLQP